MGGWFYAFHRLIKLRCALKRTIHSDEWKNDVNLNSVASKNEIESIINCDEYFMAIKTVVILMYPAIKCLRFSDCMQPGMDKLLFFVRMSSKILYTYGSNLDVIRFDSVQKFINNKSNNSKSNHVNVDDTDAHSPQWLIQGLPFQE